MKRTFTMNGKEYTSMMDIARDLGIKRVYTKDFDKYGITETTGQDTVDTTKETMNKTSVDKVDEVKNEDKQPKQDKRFTRKVGTPEQIKEVQDKVNSMNLEEFTSFIKHFSVEALVQMTNSVKVNNWETIENEPIRKMRLLMELKRYYFPNEKTSVKSSTDWRKIDFKKLVKLAKANKIQYKKYKDEKITRMYLVIALNKAGLTPDDIQEETADA